jgi:anti-sigma B factor antagonist
VSRRTSSRRGPAARAQRATGQDVAGSAAPAVPTLAVEGELTIHTAGDRRTELLGLLERGDHVAVDLSGVTELDTAGLQLLLMVRREAAHLGRTLDVVGSSPAVADTLSIVHLDPALRPLAAAAVKGDPA